jgi:hypothetical protein
MPQDITSRFVINKLFAVRCEVLRRRHRGTQRHGPKSELFRRLQDSSTTISFAPNRLSSAASSQQEHATLCELEITAVGTTWAVYPDRVYIQHVGWSKRRNYMLSLTGSVIFEDELSNEILEPSSGFVLPSKYHNLSRVVFNYTFLLYKQRLQLFLNVGIHYKVQKNSLCQSVTESCRAISIFSRTDP